MAAGPPIPERDPWPGRTLGGRFHVERPLGTGGAGSVYEAIDLRDQSRVALKVLHPELSADAVQLGRFRREARAAAAIGHPNIARLIEFADVAPNEPAFLVLELVPGRSLAEILTREPVLAPARAVELACQILAGLDAAHRAGVVHRDLKPGNVVVAERPGEPPVAKLVDFGIAQMHESSVFLRLTRTGVIVGTPRYMSPEQASGGAIDPRTDLWAVGVILYRMLTGRFPFDGRPDQIILQIVKEPPPPFGAELGVAPAIEAVVRRALEKGAGARWPSALAMQSALRVAIGDLPATAEARLPPPRAEARTAEMPMRVSVETLGHGLLDRTTEEPRPSFGSMPPTTAIMTTSPSVVPIAPPSRPSFGAPQAGPPADGGATSRRRSSLRIAFILVGALGLGLVLTGCLLAPWIGACVGLWEFVQGGCVIR